MSEPHSKDKSEKKKKKREEKNLKLIQEMASFPDNQACADCYEKCNFNFK